ncbi:hypothetical protein ACHAWX_001570 [Stephanocyclus meneghinianus]
MPSNGRKQYRHHQGKRKHDNLSWDGDVQEESVDDLLIASMAVASTWRDEYSPLPVVDKSSSSQSENESEGSTDKGSDSDDDGVSKHDPDEISIPSSDQNEAVANMKENDDRKLMEKSDTNENSLNLRVQEEDKTDDDDGSEIDLTEHLAKMEDDEEDAPKTSKGNQSKESFGIYEGPKTEHEIDPYKCPTEELEKLNVCVGIERDILGDLALLDEATRNQLRIAGTIRTYLVEQRTIVVDSLIPAALQGDHQNHNSMDAPLDEGSMLAILLGKGEDGTHEITTLKKDNECSLHVVGKILEVFGPVQRPLYVIRLPDSQKAGKSSVPFETEEKPRNEPSEMTPHEEVPAVGSLLEIKGSDSIENVNDVEGRGSKIKEEAEDKDSMMDGSLSDGISPEQVSAINVPIEGTCEEKESSDSKAEEDDPWSHNGKLSCILRKSPNAVVYSLLNHVKLIDKDFIIRVSGKGCDASNMFDEEVGPSEQQDFSDDEDEREARKGNRKSRQPVKNDGQLEKRRDGLNNCNGRSSMGREGVGAEADGMEGAWGIHMAMPYTIRIICSNNSNSSSQSIMHHLPRQCNINTRTLDIHKPIKLILHTPNNNLTKEVTHCNIISNHFIHSLQIMVVTLVIAMEHRLLRPHLHHVKTTCQWGIRDKRTRRMQPPHLPREILFTMSTPDLKHITEKKLLLLPITLK